MRERELIFVDGIKTREAVDIKAGRKRGMVGLCKAAGVSQPVLSDICIKGYGTPKTIRKMQEAGIPIIFSPTPVPSRIAREYKKGKNREPASEDIQKEHTKNRKEKADPEKPETETFKLGDESIEVPVWSPKTETHQTKQISFEDFIGETKADQMRKIIIKGLTEIITELYKL